MGGFIINALVDPKDPPFFHPKTVLLILLLDWLLFGATAASLGFLVLFAMFFGFGFGSFATMLSQRVYGKDGWLLSIGKGFLGGFVVGWPTPVFGTIGATILLALAGISVYKEYKKLQETAQE